MVHYRPHIYNHELTKIIKETSIRNDQIGAFLDLVFHICDVRDSAALSSWLLSGKEQAANRLCIFRNRRRSEAQGSMQMADIEHPELGHFGYFFYLRELTIRYMTVKNPLSSKRSVKWCKIACYDISTSKGLSEFLELHANIMAWGYEMLKRQMGSMLEALEWNEV